MRDNMSRSASWVHSAIASRVRAPASTAVWASVSTVARACRTPLGSRGSGTCANTSISGRRDSPAVGEDDMAAGDFRDGRCVETRSPRGVPRRPVSNTRHISHTRNRRSVALSAYFADTLVQDLTGKTDQLDGLARIGIDEISYRKGNRFLTCAVDHDTGRLVWAHPGRNKETLTMFFDALGETRSALLTPVWADGAEWIHTVVTQYAPRAAICLDPFYSDLRVMPMLGREVLVGAGLRFRLSA